MKRSCRRTCTKKDENRRGLSHIDFGIRNSEFGIKSEICNRQSAIEEGTVPKKEYFQKNVISNQKGVSVVIIIATMLILSVMGAVLISLVTTGSDVSVNQLRAYQAFNIAEGGREYIVEAAAFPNYYTPAPIALGSGSFTVTTPTRLTADPGIAGTMIDVQSTAGFPSSGRIVIDSEMIDYTGTTSNSFTGATRGVGGTTASAHPANNSVYPVTDLTGNLSVAASTVNVTSTTGYAIPGIVKIDDEYLYCTGNTAVAFTGCQRGYAGSTAAVHGVGSNVLQYIVTITATAGNAQRVVRATVESGSGGSGITFDNSKSGKTNNAISMQWNHKVSSGTYRILVVGVSIRNDAGQTVSAVTYGGTQNLTLIDARDNVAGVRVELWYLVAPASGNNQVEVTLTGAADMVGGSVSFTGVDQTSPIDASAFASGSSTSPGVTVTTVADNAWVVDTLAAVSNVSASVGPAQTEQWNSFAGTGGNKMRGAGSTEGPQTPPGGVTMSWSLASSRDWAIGAVSLKSATSIPGPVRILEFRETY